MEKYNYLWFISDQYEIDNLYSDIKDCNHVKFVCKNSIFKNRFINYFFHIIFSQVINSHIYVPFKKFWFSLLYKYYKFNNNKPTILIFHEGWFDLDISRWVKCNKDKKIYSVIYFDDTIECYRKAIPSMKPELLGEQYDFVLCYNPGDAKKYGYLKTQVYFTPINKEKLTSHKHSDICFIGQDKGREQIVLDIYNKLCCKCITDFIIVGNEDKQLNGLQYTSEYLSYFDYLSHEYSSDCILEILKGDTEGATYRCWEAVIYNKKLITNWKGVFDFEYYNPKFMQYFETAEDIDINFINSKINIDYSYNNENSPTCFLDLLRDLVDKSSR